MQNETKNKLYVTQLLVFQLEYQLEYLSHYYFLTVKIADFYCEKEEEKEEEKDKSLRRPSNYSRSKTTTLLSRSYIFLHAICKWSTKNTIV